MIEGLSSTFKGVYQRFKYKIKQNYSSVFSFIVYQGLKIFGGLLFAGIVSKFLGSKDLIKSVDRMEKTLSGVFTACLSYQAYYEVTSQSSLQNRKAIEYRNKHQVGENHQERK
ncbi:MAG: hypothetical protein J0H68_04360 [Sphingobacteriia bacterium]|nr:hypothetical protein [Sphingobacteriia bacterium]